MSEALEGFMRPKSRHGTNKAPLLTPAALALLLLHATSTTQAAEVVEYYHLDAIGNVRAVTNAAGQVVERHDYLPFGEECTTGPCAANLALGSGQPRRFTGKERDAETGLDYFGARYYGSKIGRFTTVDPYLDQSDAILNPQLWNRYAYGRNSPFRYVDPDGRATLAANSVQARMLAPPGPLPPGASGWQKALHAIALVGWALNPGGVMPAPAVMAIPEVAAAGAGATAASEVARGGARGVGFLVSEGGDAIPVPSGAKGPVPVVNPGGKTTGFAFTEGSGGRGLDAKVTGVRVMDPVPPRGASPGYPNGYVAYENAAGQGVNAASGRTVPNADPTRHIPLNPKPE